MLAAGILTIVLASGLNRTTRQLYPPSPVRRPLRLGEAQCIDEYASGRCAFLFPAELRRLAELQTGTKEKAGADIASRVPREPVHQ